MTTAAEIKIFTKLALPGDPEAGFTTVVTGNLKGSADALL
jgi:hypothetical protein